jgi:two-component system, OmpR family, sensor histidine kinase KdpD
MSSMAAVPPLPPRTKPTRPPERLNGFALDWLPRLRRFRGRGLGPYVWSTLAVALATVTGAGIGSLTPLPNVSLVFLLAVVFSAAVFGIWPALLTSILSFLAYNFFFIEPHYTLSVSQPHELLALFVFLIIAVLTATLAGRARLEATKAVDRAQASQHLYEFARRLSSLGDLETVLDGAVRQVHSELGRPTVILLADHDCLAVAAAWPPEHSLGPDEISAAQQIFTRGKPPGAEPDMAPSLPWLFLPLRQDRSIGLIGVARVPAEGPLDPEVITLLRTLAELTAAALERARLGQEISTAQTAAETERMRNILLSSISHDFRTPLASVLGAATSLIDYGGKLPEAARRDLLVQVKDEAEHLDGMVRNLLAMTRVEAHALEVNKDWVDVRELFDRTAAVARRRGATQTFAVIVANDLPFVPADPTLLDQVLTNLVGNAMRYAGPHAHITLEAKRDGADVLLSVTDDGPGVPANILPRVFERFVHAPTRGDGGQSTGLGLAIAKGIVEAHQGAISAESPIEGGRGARITVRLPLMEAPQ